MAKVCMSNIDSRLATIEGHVRAVRKMISSDDRCEDILRQLVAISAAVKKAGVELLKSHMEHCVKDAMKEGSEDIANELNSLIGTYLWIG